MKAFKKLCLDRRICPELLLEKDVLKIFEKIQRVVAVWWAVNLQNNSSLICFVNFHIGDVKFLWRAVSGLFHVRSIATVNETLRKFCKTKDWFMQHKKFLKSMVKTQKSAHNLIFFKDVFCGFIYRSVIFGDIYWVKNEFQICWADKRG